MGIIQAEILPIKDFLRNSALHIPSFQRPYKWSVKNVSQLLADIQLFANATSYRIGTIVIYKEKDRYNIVDGQQRTITFLLILNAIIANVELENVELKNLLSDVKKNAFTPFFRNETSKKNVQYNYREIERRIKNIKEIFIDFFLNRCEVAYFVIDDISEAFQLFDSQNARGRDLEPQDLLKAFHLRELNRQKINEDEKALLVHNWEEIDSRDLSKLFADFLYRVKGWSNGRSSRYFTKEDTTLFKGISLNSTKIYPYTQIYRIVDRYVSDKDENRLLAFPFQLDQPVINGKYFFEMVTYYNNIYGNIRAHFEHVSVESKEIISLIDNYEGKNRMGDKYVRLLFDCALLYYVDRFGVGELSQAIEKIFIWAYSPRLRYQNLRLESVDNYVIYKLNLFKKIKESIHGEEVGMIELPLIREDHETSKTAAIKKQFQKMKYYAN